MQEIDGNIFVETKTRGSNDSIVCTRDGLVLIDAPLLPSDALRWRRAVEACGRARFLVNTDHHIDHVLGNAFLPGGICVSHEGTRQQMAGAFPSEAAINELLEMLDPDGKMYMDDYRPRLPEVTYNDRLALQVGGLEFSIAHFPGHTPNSSLVYLVQQKIVFAGDLVCEAGLPSFLDADIFSWLKTLEAIEAMEVRYLVPGHGNVCGMAEVKEFRREMEALMSEIQSRIERNHTRDEVVRDVSYEDRVHPTISDLGPGYSAAYVRETMEGSIAAIYDQLLDHMPGNR